MKKLLFVLLFCLGLPTYGQDMLEALKTGGLELVKTVVQGGGDINAKDKYGRTALHHAANNEYVEVIKYLVSLGQISIQKIMKVRPALKIAKIKIIKK